VRRLLLLATLAGLSISTPATAASPVSSQIDLGVCSESADSMRRPAFHAMRRLDRRWPKLLALMRARLAAERSDPARARRLALRIAGPYR
jgi:hypothetical protein